MNEELAAQELAALKHDIERHLAICSEQATRIAELEAALRESELILTALAMSPESARTLVCSDAKLSPALRAARDCLR